MAQSVSFFVTRDFIPGDTVFFKLHYRVTFSALLACGVINCFVYFFGQPLGCTSLQSDVPREMNDFCWLQLTSGDSDQFTDPRDAQRSHKYLWLPLFFFFQAVLVYLPHAARMVFNESDVKAKCFVSRLNNASQLNDEERREKVATNARYFVESLHLREGIAKILVICEVFNFVIALFNVFITAKYFGYSVPEFHSRVDGYLWGDARNFSNPMAEVFPRTKDCVFPLKAPDGTSVERKVICKLSLNIFNEKVYIVLWIWFMFVACVLGFGLLFRVVAGCSGYYRLASLRTRAKTVEEERLRAVNVECMFGDWWLLYIVGRHADPFVFGEFVEALAKLLVRPVPPIEPLGGGERESEKCASLA